MNFATKRSVDAVVDDAANMAQLFLWHALAGCREFLGITGGLHFVATAGL
jgi:hypothetical protein